jgi:hypothetical protein
LLLGAGSCVLAIGACNGIVGIEPATVRTPDAGDETIASDDGGDDADGGDGAVTCSEDIDFSTDPNNCGRCGRSCFGKACKNAVCAPEVVMSHDFGGGIYGLAIDDKKLYWTEPYDDALQSVVKKGGPYVTLAPTEYDPGAVAVAGGNVYWIQLFNGHIWDVATGGGTPQIMATSAPYLCLVAADDTSFYFTDHDNVNGFVAKIPLGGGPITMLGTHADACEIVLDATTVYWGADGAVYAVPKSGGATTVVLDASANAVLVALDDVTIYWTTKDGFIRSMPKAGGNIQVLASLQGFMNALVVDGDRIYWSSTTKERIFSAAKIDGSDLRMLATNVSGPDNEVGLMVLDDVYVYWFGFANWIYRTPK